MVHVEIPARFAGRGYLDLCDALTRTATALGKEIVQFGQTVAPKWEQVAVGAVKLIVYENPPGTHIPFPSGRGYYKRTFKLAEAIVSEVTPITNMGVEIIIRNDTAMVQPTYPKGGSPPERVPFEIEEGTYPSGWLGDTSPRAYMEFTLSIIDDIMDQDLLPAVDRGLAEFRR